MEKSEGDRSFRSVAQTTSRMFSLFRGSMASIESLPEVHLDNYLILWGLRYRKFGETVRSNWKLWYFRLAVIYQVFMSIRWVAISVISWWTKDEHLLMYMGDFTAYLHGSREYYHVLITFATIYPTVLMVYCYYWRDDEIQFAWMKPFEVYKKQVSQITDLQITETMAIKLWQRLTSNLWHFRLVAHPLQVICMSVIGYCLYDEMSWEDFASFGYIWFILTIPWSWFTINCLIGISNVFNSVCYYLRLRFEKTATEVDYILANVDSVDYNSRCLMVWCFLKEHNESCLQLNRFNRFWQLFLLLHFVIYLPIIFLGLFERFIAFENISQFHMTIISTFTLVTFFGWTHVAMSASSVAISSHSVYGSLNKLVIVKLPVQLKQQLDTYIRRLGGPIIGFNVYRMFTVTHENYYNVIMFMGSYFLLILDAPDIRKAYRV